MADNQPIKHETNIISTKKVTSSIASYIWDSPCLKPLIFNPFVLSIFIILVIWIIDFGYDKKFVSNRHSTVIQHIFTTYFIVAAGIVLNNILIKHHYRLSKYEKKVDDTNNTNNDLESSNAILSDYE